MSSRRAVISSACVHDVVSSAFSTPTSCSRNLCAFLVKAPSPEMWPLAIASTIYFCSLPRKQARLNGMVMDTGALTDAVAVMALPSFLDFGCLQPKIHYYYSRIEDYTTLPSYLRNQR